MWVKYHTVSAWILFKNLFVIPRTDSFEETNQRSPNSQDESSQNKPQPDSDLDRWVFNASH